MTRNEKNEMQAQLVNLTAQMTNEIDLAAKGTIDAAQHLIVELTNVIGKLRERNDNSFAFVGSDAIELTGKLAHLLTARNVLIAQRQNAAFHIAQVTK